MTFAFAAVLPQRCLDVLRYFLLVHDVYASCRKGEKKTDHPPGNSARRRPYCAGKSVAVRITLSRITLTRTDLARIEPCNAANKHQPRHRIRH